MPNCKLLVLFLTLLLTACQGDDQSHDQNDAQNDDRSKAAVAAQNKQEQTTQIKPVNEVANEKQPAASDSLPLIEEYPYTERPYNDAKSEIVLYDLQGVWVDNDLSTNFIPLSDHYVLSDHPDSSMIDEKYLQRREVSDRNFHELNAERRKMYLEKLGIKESDQIHVYGFYQDITASYKVSESRLIAFLSPYETGGPSSHYDYLIGLELTELPFQNDFYSRRFAVVGPTNPFQTNRIAPIDWQKPSTPFPDFPRLGRDSIWLKRYNAIDSFQFTLNNYVYNLINWGSNQTPVARQLIVTDETGTSIFNRTYFDSEGTYLSPLNGMDGDGNVLFQQWTGELLKGRPPVFWGFLEHSFGCPAMDILAPNEPALRIRCDNRH